MTSTTNEFRALNEGIQAGLIQKLEVHVAASASTGTTVVPGSMLRRNPDFVDRGDTLGRIEDICSKPAARVALVGLGGIGKSHIAIEYAHRLALDDITRWIFWVHAATQARVIEDFNAIANVVRLPGREDLTVNVLQLVLNWLSDERNGRWTLILDSADDRDVFFSSDKGTKEGKQLHTYIPQSRNGNIIITTRDKDLARRMTGRHQNVLDINPMTEVEACSLLRNETSYLSERDADAELELVNALDLVPLAISQAGAFIQERMPRMSIEKYLRDFRESEPKRVKLLQFDQGDLQRDGSASNAILTTWLTSFEHIKTKRPSAADLLSLMCFFDRQGIPESVLRIQKARKEEDQAGQTGEQSGPGPRGGLDDTFEDDIHMLRNFSLVTTDSSGHAFEMHRLVQLSTKRWLSTHKEDEKFKQQFVSRMAAVFPDPEYEKWETCRVLFPHAILALEYEPAKGDVQEMWELLLRNCGEYATDQGRFLVAEQMLREAQRTSEARRGNDDPATTHITRLRAVNIFEMGDWAEAETLLVQVLKTEKAVLGTDHPDTLASMNSLALTYYRQGRLAEAEELHVQALEKTKAVLGTDHPDTLKIMNNLALTYLQQGQWVEAEELQEQVLEKRKAVLGTDHPDTLKIMNNLALTYYQQGRWVEAEELQEQVLKKRNAVLGADHPDTLSSMNNLATTWGKQGRRADAVGLRKSCVESARRVLGADHRRTKRYERYLEAIGLDADD
ncbi:tpr domain containing protein [Grosmannia clavigera kw1407]|uniref:Tpr domain containing protein n=1 Tax=Grosmannia clavigera (strain kw1407 / UAMH 11150) TaxID=655863 RepID=F0XI78_GROCL|nr:tpr domain containing protein [Grosmannia clavigera kw1407]EFX02667.1 tpr domain containing protein [Grosmannia clavigera kw1407]